MMLPGISGASILILLGAQVPALDVAHPEAASAAQVNTLLPVAPGALVGALAMSNVIARLLVKHEKAMLGAMLGFLCGSVVDLARWQVFEPTGTQLIWAVGIGFLGFLLTALLAKYSDREPSERAIEPRQS